MINLREILPNFTFRQPETIWLEPEQLEQEPVNSLTNPLINEAEQWQLYLNSLAILGFEQWLQKRIPEHSIERTQCINQIDAVYNFKVDEFKLNLIVKEHLLDEVVEIPNKAINQPDLVAHFYVLLEVVEEEQQVMIRGFLRYDRLLNYCNQTSEGLQQDNYQISLFAFDPELNHLLFYCDILEPASIPLPVFFPEHSTGTQTSLILLSAPQQTCINLGQWIEGVFDAGWQTIDDLFGSEVYLAWNSRNQREGAKRGKLIDLGLDLQGQKVVLLVNVTKETDQKLSVIVQLHPVTEEQYLPPQITLSLLSQTGKKLQEVRSRTQDNYIQLKSFKGRSGTSFNIKVSLGDVSVRENFEL